MTQNVLKIAKAFGFGEAYCLRPEPFPYYREKREKGEIPFSPELVDSPQDAFPWATALLLLIWPYRPYPASAPIASNYPFYHTSYRAHSAMIRYLNACDIRAEKAYVPFRELAMRNGIGVALQNGLMAIPPHGTRFTTHVLAVEIPDPVFWDASAPSPHCRNCGACAKVCPAKAIDADGFHVKRCFRAYMEPGLLPEPVMRAMQKTIGCDICQEPCPYNRQLPENGSVPEAFLLDRLVRDDCGDALLWIGRNMKSGDRLCQHAMIVAANRHRTDFLQEIEKHLDDPREPIRQAAEYAISVLRNS